MNIKYIARCQYCGRKGPEAWGDRRENPPQRLPKIPGTCLASPSQTHVPRWEIKK